MNARSSHIARHVTGVRSRASAIGVCCCVAILLATGGGVANGQSVWELMPYRIHAMVTVEPGPELTAKLRTDLPALVIHGGQSRLYGSEAGRWIAATLPRARYEDFPGSGHTPHLEEPERFNQSISAFRMELDRNNSFNPETPAPAA